MSHDTGKICPVCSADMTQRELVNDDVFDSVLGD